MSFYPTEIEVQVEDVAQVEIAAVRRDLIAKRLEGDQALALIVERMCNVTRATAAAIALVDGSEIVCRASGGNAPSIGARVDPDSGLSGECLRTGDIVRCEDTETDPRADRLVCRSLELRSILIVPVRHQGRPGGVLEVFSSWPYAFESNDEKVLGQLAELVAEIAVRQPQPTAPLSTEMMVTSVEPLLIQPQLEEGTPPSNNEILARPTAEQVAPSAAIAEEPGDDQARIAAKPQPKCQPETVIAEPSVLAVKSLATTPGKARVDVEPAAPVVSIISEQRRDEPPACPSECMAPLASVAAHRIFPPRMRAAGTGILLMVLLVGAWQGWRTVTPANGTSTSTQPKQAHTDAAVAVSEPAPLPAVYPTTATSNPTPAQQKPARRAVPITLPPPDIANASAPPAMTVFARPVDEVSSISTVLGAPVAAPQRDGARVSQTSGGKLIKKVAPIYPPSVAQGVHGEVVLKATINRKGQVTKVNVVRGPTVLAQAAIAAVTHWRYEPFLLNGVPIEVESDIILNFRVPGQ
jgi:TonB family protein